MALAENIIQPAIYMLAFSSRHLPHLLHACLCLACHIFMSFLFAHCVPAAQHLSLTYNNILSSSSFPATHTALPYALIPTCSSCLSYLPTIQPLPHPSHIYHISIFLFPTTYYLLVYFGGWDSWVGHGWDGTLHILCCGQDLQPCPEGGAGAGFAGGFRRHGVATILYARM